MRDRPVPRESNLEEEEEEEEQVNFHISDDEEDEYRPNPRSAPGDYSVRVTDPGMSQSENNNDNASDDDSPPTEEKIIKYPDEFNPNTNISESIPKIEHQDKVSGISLRDSSSNPETAVSEHSSRKRKRKQKEEKAPEQKRPPTSVFSRPIRPPTLLEKLLLDEIKRERNLILQCVRFVCNNNFLQK